MANIIKLIVPILIFTSLLGGCKNIFESKDKGVENLNEIENRWDDAIDIASSTARIALPTPVANLQNIKRDLKNVELSDCLKPAREVLNDYMDIKINTFLKFMADQEPTKFGSDDKLIKYFAIKKECTGNQGATNPSKLENEARTAEVMAKIKAEKEAAIMKAAKEKGISVEAMAAASEAATAASEAAAAASEAAAAVANL